MGDLPKESVDCILDLCDRLDEENLLKSDEELAAVKQLKLYLRTQYNNEEEEEVLGLDEAARAFIEGFRERPQSKSESEMLEIQERRGTLIGIDGQDRREEKRKKARKSLRLAITAAWVLTSKAAPCNDSLDAELDKLMDWAEFDVFKVSRLTDGKPLETVAMMLFEHFRLVDKLKLDEKKLANFLKAVEMQYLPNPYHNNAHAADVTQSLGCILSADEFVKDLTDLEVFSLILAAAMHDVGHPGFNNDFLINAGDATALAYNDKSVNENMHLAKGWHLLTQKDCDILSHLSREDYKFVRKLVIEVILATDMAHHQALLKAFEAAVDTWGPKLSQWDTNYRTIALQMVVHCADLANPAKPPRFAGEWTARVIDEFFHQGEEERRRGMPVNPLFDKDKVIVSTSQAGFLDFVVRPLYQALSRIAPRAGREALKWIDHNRQKWEKLKASSNPLAIIGIHDD